MLVCSQTHDSLCACIHAFDERRQISGQHAGGRKPEFVIHQIAGHPPIVVLPRIDVKIFAPLRKRLVEHGRQFIDRLLRGQIGIKRQPAARQFADSRRPDSAFIDLPRLERRRRAGHNRGIRRRRKPVGKQKTEDCQDREQKATACSCDLWLIAAH